MLNAEPFKIKVVEPIRLIPRIDREEALKEAGYNVFSLRSEDVYIDLLTDSGTCALSDSQWAGMMMGDESYAGSKSYYRLANSVKEIFGYKHVIPTHQGRGAEQVLFPHLVKAGQWVIGNMHFDTTMAHIEMNGGKPINMVVEEAMDTSTYFPFKGNVDVAKMDEFITSQGADKIAFVLITVTCNSCGGQPVSMENIRQTAEVAKKHGIKVLFDAARFAENAYFIKQREDEFKDKSIMEIVREMFSYAESFTMSAKKNGLSNMGGIIGIKEDEELYKNACTTLVPMEGFTTYGGLTGRDMESLARGLMEACQFEFLDYRCGQVEYLGKKLMEYGIPVQYPTGGHAVFVDAAKLLPHIPWNEFPAVALCNELYMESGVRGVEVGSFLLGTDPQTGKDIKSSFEFLRLTIPARVYTNSHMDVIAQGIAKVKERCLAVRGVEIVEQPKVLRHFTSKLKPL